MAGPKKDAANGQVKKPNTKEKRLEKRAKGLADLEQLEKAVAELVRHRFEKFPELAELIEIANDQLRTSRPRLSRNSLTCPSPNLPPLASTLPISTPSPRSSRAPHPWPSRTSTSSAPPRPEAEKPLPSLSRSSRSSTAPAGPNMTALAPSSSRPRESWPSRSSKC